jgi:hypothetical protein
MSKHLLEEFFNNEKDNSEPLYMAIDCWEQVIYKALQSYDLDRKYVFVKNIYPVYAESESRWSLLLPERKLKQSVYDVEDIDFSIHGPCATIESLISKNKSVAFHTAFDSISCYDKKEILILGRLHYATIIGYDEMNFYVMDNPFMFDKTKINFYHDYNNIGIIEKTVLNEALKKKCDLKTIQINVDSFASLDNLDWLINQIVEDFNSEKMDKLDNYTLFYGRRGLIKLINALDISGAECLKNSFLNNHYNAHLLYSCRLILKWCLEEDKGYCNSPFFCEIIDNLNASLGKWQIVKMMIAKNNAKHSSNFYKKLKEKMLMIYETEEKFVESISHLI